MLLSLVFLEFYGWQNVIINPKIYLKLIKELAKIFNLPKMLMLFSLKY